MFIIFRVLLTLIHLLYGSFLWGRRQWREWKLWCDELWHGKDSRLEAEVLISSIKGVGNLPKHLAVILGHEAVSFLDLVRIVSWCVIAGIPYVSFYDHNGNLGFIAYRENCALLSKNGDSIADFRHFIAKVFLHFIVFFIQFFLKHC